jgi:hypothetical protein
VPEANVRAGEPPFADIVQKSTHQKVGVAMALLPQSSHYVQAVSLIALAH